MASLTDIDITKPATNALTKVKKLETYNEFIGIVKEYNNNNKKLGNNLQKVEKVDPKSIEKNRDKYFLTLIKKQAGLKNIPVDAGTSTFNLLYKRALKLNAIISVYANGKKTKEYEDFEIFSAKEKWKNKLMNTTIDTKDNKELLKKCKDWLDYLKKLIRFLENEKNESKVEELFSNMIKSENNKDNTRSQAHIISELKKILGTKLSVTKTMKCILKNIAADVTRMDSVEYGAQYRLLKDFFTRVRKNYDYKKSREEIEPYDIELIFGELTKSPTSAFLVEENQKEIIQRIKNNKKATKSNSEEANKRVTERAKQGMKEIESSSKKHKHKHKHKHRSSDSESSKKKHKHKHRSLDSESSKKKHKHKHRSLDSESREKS